LKHGKQRSVQVHPPVMSVFEKLFSDFHNKN
jgi:hypothetical protein